MKDFFLLFRKISHDICLSLEKYLPRLRDMKSMMKKIKKFQQKRDNSDLKKNKKLQNSKLQKKNRDLRYFRQKGLKNRNQKKKIVNLNSNENSHQK